MLCIDVLIFFWEALLVSQRAWKRGLIFSTGLVYIFPTISERHGWFHSGCSRIVVSFSPQGWLVYFFPNTPIYKHWRLRPHAQDGLFFFPHGWFMFSNTPNSALTGFIRRLKVVIFFPTTDWFIFFPKRFTRFRGVPSEASATWTFIFLSKNKTRSVPTDPGQDWLFWFAFLSLT